MPTHAFSPRAKIMVSLITLLIVAVALVGITSYFVGKKLLRDCVFSKLSSICIIKDGQTEQYLSMLQDQCLSMSESTMVVQAMEALRAGFQGLDVPEAELATYKQELQKFYSDEFLPRINKTAQTPRTVQDYFPLDIHTIIAQTWYIAQNPQPVQKKLDYPRAPGDNGYNSAHELYHPIFKRYAQRVGIADLYLVDLTTGHVVYSLAKEIDFGTNLLSGPFKETGLGKSFLELQKTSDENFVRIIDFQFYDPSYGTPVGFISTPIFSHGTKVGGLIFKFPIDSINDILTYNKHWQEVGLGKTGESYLIGPDKTMRTIARQYIEDPTAYIKMLREHAYDGTILDKIQVYDTTVLLKKVDLAIIGDVLSGKQDTVITVDTMGTEVIFSYSPVEMGDIRWYILVKMTTQEAFESIQTLLWYIIVCGILVILLAILIIYFVVVMVTKPLSEVIHVKEVARRVAMVQEQCARLQQSILRASDELIRGTNTLGESIKQAQDQLDTITAAYKESESLDQQETAYNAQIVTLASLIDTTQESLTQYVDEICRAMSDGETVPSEIKNTMQQMVRVCTSIAPLIINARNSCKQIIHLFEEIGTKQEQKNERYISVVRLLRDLSVLMNHVERTVIDNNNLITGIQKSQQEYAKSISQLEEVTKGMQS
jgi:methyl-accepting chemotaxis protein